MIQDGVFNIDFVDSKIGFRCFNSLKTEDVFIAVPDHPCHGMHAVEPDKVVCVDCEYSIIYFIF